MTNKDGAIHFEITADDSDFRQKLADSRQAILNSGKIAQEQGTRIEEIFKRANRASDALFTADQAVDFGRDIIRVRGEIRSMGETFEVLLGSKAQAMSMVADIQRLAMETPLEMPQVSGAVETLLGFGVSAESVMGIVGQLSDVSMDSAERFQVLALAYGQTQAAGQLMEQDLAQMVSAGFDPLRVIADSAGRSVAQLMEDLAAGAVSAGMVADAFIAATSAGGEFYSMTLNQAESMAELQSSLEEAITNQMSRFSEKIDELISDESRFAQSVVEESSTVAQTLAILREAYGNYKTAIVAVTAVQKLIKMSGDIGAWLQLAKGIKTAEDAQTALNLAMGANPMVKIISLIIAAGTAIYSYVNSTKEAEQELTGLAKATYDATDEFDEQRSKISALQDIMNDGNIAYEERQRALTELKKLIPEYNGELNKEGVIINGNTDAIKLYLEQLEKEIKMKALKDEMEQAYRQKFRDERALNVAESDVESNAAKGKPSGVGQSGSIFGQVVGYVVSYVESGPLEAKVKEASEALDKTNGIIDDLRKEMGIASTSTVPPKVDDSTENPNEGTTTDDQKKSDQQAKAAQARYAAAAEAERRASEKALADRARANEESIKAEQRLKDALVAITFQNKQAEIDAKEEGFDKEMAQIDLNYQKRLAAIDGWEQEQLRIVEGAQMKRFVADGGSKEDFVFDPNEGDTAGATADISNSAAAQRTASTAQSVGEEKRLIDELKAKWMSWAGEYQESENQITQIKEKAAQARKGIQDRLDSRDINLLEASQAVGAVDTGEDEQVNAAKSAQYRLTDSWKSMFRDVSTLSNGSIRSIIKDIEGELANNENLTPEIASDLDGQLKKAKGAVKSNNPFTALTSAIKDYQDAETDTEKSDGLSEVFSAGAGGAAALSQGLGSVSGMLKSVGVDSPALDGVVGALGVLGSMDLSNPMSMVTAGVSFITSIVGVGAAERKKKLEQELKESKMRLKELEYAYEDLNREVEKTIGTEKYQQSGRQIEAIQRQQLELQNQIRLEQSAKNVNDEAVADLNRQVKELSFEIEDLLVKLKDDIMGGSATDFASSLGDALFGGLSEGKDKAIQAWDEAADEIVGNMVRKMLITKFLEEPMQKLTDDYYNKINPSAGATVDLTKKKMELEAENKELEKMPFLPQKKKKIEENNAQLAKINQQIKEAEETGMLITSENAAEFGNSIKDLGDSFYENIVQGGFEDLFKDMDNNKAENTNSLAGEIRGTIATEQSVSELGGIMRRDSDNIHRIGASIDLGFATIAEMARVQLQIETNTRQTADNTAGIVDTNKKLDMIIKNTTPENVKFK